MSLKESLKVDMKAAMKAREEGKLALSVIRMVNSAIKNAEINEKRELVDSDILGILAKEVKMRKDSIAEFEKANRPDLVAQNQAEINVLQKYLPTQMSEDEVRKTIQNIIAGMDATPNMGVVMSEVMPKLKGRADGRLISRLVKEELAK